jgi:hypothetical protein
MILLSSFVTATNELKPRTDDGTTHQDLLNKVEAILPLIVRSLGLTEKEETIKKLSKEGVALVMQLSKKHPKKHSKNPPTEELTDSELGDTVLLALAVIFIVLIILL